MIHQMVENLKFIKTKVSIWALERKKDSHKEIWEIERKNENLFLSAKGLLIDHETLLIMYLEGKKAMIMKEEDTN